MNTIENGLNNLNNTSESKETLDFAMGFESLKKKFASLQGYPIDDSKNNPLRFESSSEKVKVSVVEDHSVNSKTFFKENGSYYFTSTFWDINETIKIESQQEFEKVYHNMLNEYINVINPKNEFIYMQHNEIISQEVKEAESILENELNKLD